MINYLFLETGKTSNDTVYKKRNDHGNDFLHFI